LTDIVGSGRQPRVAEKPDNAKKYSYGDDNKEPPEEFCANFHFSSFLKNL
jgi:hypothetical protein